MLKKLLLLVVILIVLIAVNFAMRARSGPSDIVEQARLTSLTPHGLAVEDIQRLELFAGGNPDEKLALERRADGAWIVSSRFDAPVRDQKIQDYLRDVAALRGQFRATVENEAALEQYGLGDDAAFHVVGYAADLRRPAFHLLTGRAPGVRTVFMREKDSLDVYVEAVNLRSAAGLYSQDATAAVDAKTWIDSTMIELDRDAVERIALDMPDKRIVLERRALPKEDADPGQTGGEDEAAFPESETEYEWVVAEGGPGTPLNEAGLDSLLRRLEAFHASDVADPEKLADWGLDAPPYRCTVALRGVDDPIELAGARHDAGRVYMTVAGNGLVYEVNRYTFEELFPRGSTLFELPALGVGMQAVDRIDVAREDAPISVRKERGAWRVETPAADLDVLEPTVAGMAAVLAAWRPADYADADKVEEFTPERSVVFAAGARRHTLAVGGPSRHIDGVYVRLDDDEMIYAMSQMDLDRVFVAPCELYSLDLFDVDEEDIAEITVEQNGMRYVLRRTEEDSWLLALNGEEAPADAEAAEELALAIADLQARDIAFGAEQPDVGVVAETVFTTVDNVRHVLALGAADDDGVRPARRSGLENVVHIAPEDAAALLAPPEKYLAAAFPDFLSTDAVAPDADEAE